MGELDQMTASTFYVNHKLSPILNFWIFSLVHSFNSQVNKKMKTVSAFRLLFVLSYFLLISFNHLCRVIIKLLINVGCSLDLLLLWHRLVEYPMLRPAHWSCQIANALTRRNRTNPISTRSSATAYSWMTSQQVKCSPLLQDTILTAPHR